LVYSLAEKDSKDIKTNTTGKHLIVNRLHKGGFGVAMWAWASWIDHQRLLASDLNAASLSLPGMISLANPTWRKHSTI